MTATLDRARENGNSGKHASRRWLNGKRDPIGTIVGRVLDMTPMSAEQLLRSVNHRCAAIIHAFKQLGDDVRLARFMEPIERALQGREPPPDCEATWMLAEEADAAEDVAELRYHLDKSDENLRAVIRRKRDVVNRETALIDAFETTLRQRGARLT